MYRGSFQEHERDSAEPQDVRPREKGDDRVDEFKRERCKGGRRFREVRRLMLIGLVLHLKIFC